MVIVSQHIRFVRMSHTITSLFLLIFMLLTDVYVDQLTASNLQFPTTNTSGFFSWKLFWIYALKKKNCLDSLLHEEFLQTLVSSSFCLHSDYVNRLARLN